MMAQRLSITEVNRPNVMSVVSPTDFICKPEGEIDSDEVLRDPKYSLYCFHPENQSALFIEAGDPEAVDRAPFYYQGQVEQAVGLVSMPFEAFQRLADGIPHPSKRLIWVHSVGRCGSTLVSKALAAVPGVHSLSEPDDLTQLSAFWAGGEWSDELAKSMLASSVKWRCKPRSGGPAEQVAIKTRSEVLVLADLFGSAFGDAKHFFLYRDAVAWMKTIFRGIPPEAPVYDEAFNRKFEESWAKLLPLVGELRREEAPMNPIQVRILGWVTSMEGYFKLSGYGVPLCAARFEDLTSNPVEILKQLFEFCEIGTVEWAAIHEVLCRDSQAGTMYDREERHKLNRQLPDELVRDIYDLLAARPLLRVPDVIVPGTLSVD